MKITTKNGVLNAEAETVEDSAIILAIKSGAIRFEGQVKSEAKKTRKRRKMNYFRTCPKCFKRVKGLQGLGIHNHLMHSEKVAEPVSTG